MEAVSHNFGSGSGFTVVRFLENSSYLSTFMNNNLDGLLRKHLLEMS